MPAACLAYYVNAEMVKVAGLGLSLPWKGNQPDYGRTGEQGEAGQTGLWSLPDAVEPWRYRYEHKTQ